jgi:hypothetical protein
MANTVSINNHSKPAPKWYRKTKKAVYILTVAANSMVASWGLTDQLLVTRIQLWCTVGIVAIMEALEAVLANGEEYAPVETPEQTN